MESIEKLNSFMPPTDYPSPFLSKGTNETMVDLMLLPFVHRAFLVADSSINHDYFDKLDFFKVQSLLRWYKILGERYTNQITPLNPYRNQLEKDIAANGQKVRLSYPLDLS